MMDPNKLRRSFSLFMALGIAAAMIGTVGSVGEMAVADIPFANKILTRMAWALATGSIIVSFRTLYKWVHNIAQNDWHPKLQILGLTIALSVPVISGLFTTGAEVVDYLAHCIATCLALVAGWGIWYATLKKDRWHLYTPALYVLIEIGMIATGCALACYYRVFEHQGYLLGLVLVGMCFMWLCLYSTRVGLLAKDDRMFQAIRFAKLRNMSADEYDDIIRQYYDLRVEIVGVMTLTTLAVYFGLPSIEYFVRPFIGFSMTYLILVSLTGATSNGRSNTYKLEKRGNGLSVVILPRRQKDIFALTAFIGGIALEIITVYGDQGLTPFVLAYALIGVMGAAYGVVHRVWPSPE